MFAVSAEMIDPDALRDALAASAAGACVTFEGWVRDHNEGREVTALEYEVYEPLAVSEAQRILGEARRKFDLIAVQAVHRSGGLDISECAVWVGVSASHRDAAFAACRYVIDEIKQRLPIWKKEYYRDGDSGWVNCERCASHALAE